MYVCVLIMRSGPTRYYDHILTYLSTQAGGLKSFLFQRIAAVTLHVQHVHVNGIYNNVYFVNTEHLGLFLHAL